MSSLDADLWQESINDETNSLESNKTWNLVDFPPNCKPIDFKLVLNKKLKPGGIVDKYKVHLVAKCFRQIENIKNFDTFSLVTIITSIRILIPADVIYNLIIHQINLEIYIFKWWLRRRNLYGPTGRVCDSWEIKQGLEIR